MTQLSKNNKKNQRQEHWISMQLKEASRSSVNTIKCVHMRARIDIDTKERHALRLPHTNSMQKYTDGQKKRYKI